MFSGCAVQPLHKITSQPINISTEGYFLFVLPLYNTSGHIWYIQMPRPKKTKLQTSSIINPSDIPALDSLDQSEESVRKYSPGPQENPITIDDYPEDNSSDDKSDDYPAVEG